MDFSNKTLALLLVVTLVISMSGTLLSLNRIESIRPFEVVQISGRANSDLGNVTLQINSTASLIFLVNSLDFGSGSVNTTGGFLNCNISSMGYIARGNCIGFNNVTDPLVLLNNGNVNLSVTLISNLNNTALLGGTVGGGPSFKWNISRNASGTACAVGFYAGNSSWYEVNDSSMAVCSDMGWTPGANAITVHVYANIPANSLAGQRNATFTATGNTI